MKTTTKFILPFLIMALFQINAKAQYSQIWSNAEPASGWQFIGTQNTDNDNAKELVFRKNIIINGISISDSIYILDGQTGIMEGKIGFVSINSTPVLTDVNSNGKYEILVLGDKTGSLQYDLYLYGLNGTTIVGDPNTGEKYMQVTNYPNPFQNTTTIKYTVSDNSSPVIVKIFDNNGNEVKTLVNETKNKGDYEILFNGFDLSSGVYYYQVNTGSDVGTKKMIKME